VSYSPQLQALLTRLNKYQVEAVNVGTGPCAVIGTPGSGKTATVVARVARMVEDGLDPQYILAMTFTRAAAGEMTERLAGLGIQGARVGTIHALCRQIVATETNLLQSGQLDDRNQMSFELKKLLGELRKRKQIPPRGVDREGVQLFISACKARGPCYIFNDPFSINVAAEGYIAKEAETWSGIAGLAAPQLMSIYMDIERARASKGLYGFDDMLMWAWTTLLVDEHARNKWRSRWSAVIVDEAQDSCPVQLDIARFLTGFSPCRPSVRDLACAPKTDEEPHNLTLVFDSSQSIYGWNHAQPKHAIRFAKRADTATVVLPVNYRSNATVCDVATRLVEKEIWHLSGKMKSHSGTVRPDAITIRHFPNVEAEATAAVHACMEIAQEENLKSCVILSRLTVGLLLAEIECIRHRLKYVKMASGSFFDSTACKDMLAYVRVASGMDPDGRWMRHIVNRPFRYIGNTYIARCEAEMVSTGISLMDTMLANSNQLSVMQRGALRKLDRILESLYDLAVRCERQNQQVLAAAAAAPGGGEAVEAVSVSSDAAPDSERRTPGDMIALAVKETDYLEVLRREEGLVGLDESKAAILGELARMGDMFPTAAEFLVYVDQVTIAVQQASRAGLRVRERSEDTLVLSTIHRFKGLEGKHVFLVGASQGLFPHARCTDLDEELRLLYVALTRAEETCQVSFVAKTDAEGMPLAEHMSPFVLRLVALLGADCDLKLAKS